MSTSRILNAKKNIIQECINRISALFLPFLSRTVLIYTMGSLYLGLNSLFTSVLSILSLAELGFSSAMVFSMYEPLAKNDDVTVCALLNLYKRIYRIIGIIILCAGMIVLPFIPMIIHGEIPSDINVYVLYVINLMGTASSYFLFAHKTSLLVASQRSDVISAVTTVLNFVGTALQLCCLLLFRNYYLYCIITPCMSIVNNCIVNIYTNKYYPQFYCFGTIDNSELMDIKKRVVGVFVYKVCGVFRNSFDSIIISAFLGLEILAKYNNYYYIMISISGLLSIITGSITAGVGNSIVTENKEKNYKDFCKFQYIFIWISSWCAICLACLYQPFMRLWVGKELMFSDKMIPIFCIYFFTLKWGDICYMYRQAAGLWWNDRFRPIVEASVNLVLNIILVKYIGIAGVMLSTIVCLICINAIWGSKVLFKYYFVSFKQKKYLTNLILMSVITVVVGIITYVVCELITNGIGNLIILELLLKGIVCAVLPTFLLWLCYRQFDEYQEAVSLLKNIIRFKKK